MSNNIIINKIENMIPNNIEEKDLSTNRLFNNDYKFTKTTTIKNKKQKELNLEGVVIDKKNINEYFTKLKKIKSLIKKVDFIIYVLILVNVACSLLSKNLFSFSTEEIDGIVIENNNKATDLVNNVRWFCIVMCILQVILIIVRYNLNLKLMRIKNMACDRDSIISTGQLRNLLIEIMILSTFTPPYLESLVSGRMLGGYYVYSWDAIINFFVIFKLYYSVRVYLNMSIFLSEKSMEIGRKNKLNLNVYFAVKSQLKRYPYLSLFLVFSISVLISSLILRTFEYGFTADEEIEEGSLNGSKAILNPDFKSFLDAFWLIIITMMTVGFGDIFPLTHFGRVIAVISSVIGMFLVSWLILTLSTLIELKPEENKAISLIKIHQANQKLEISAQNVIRTVCSLFLLKSHLKNFSKNYKFNQNNKNITYFFGELIILRNLQFKFLKQKKITQGISLPSDDILKNLKNKFCDDVKVIINHKNNINSIKNLNSNIINDEKEIFNGMNKIKILQDKISNFLVDFNNKLEKNNENK